MPHTLITVTTAERLRATHCAMSFMLSFHLHNHSSRWVGTIIPIFIDDKIEA